MFHKWRELFESAIPIVYSHTHMADITLTITLTLTLIVTLAITWFTSVVHILSPKHTKYLSGWITFLKIGTLLQTRLQIMCMRFISRYMCRLTDVRTSWNSQNYLIWLKCMLACRYTFWWIVPWSNISHNSSYYSWRLTCLTLWR